MQTTEKVNTVDEALGALHSAAPERDIDRDLRAERSVKITLSKNAVEPLILKWNTGKMSAYDRPTTMVFKLEPGKSHTTSVGKAQAWFGPFCIPFDMKDERDERVRRQMAMTFEEGKRRTLAENGDYPRPIKYGEGYEPIGPHRFPDVMVQVTEATGEVWPEIRLHELYKIGEWDPLKETFVDYAAINAERAEQRENDAQRIARLEGQIASLTSMISGKPAGKAI